MKKLRYYLVGFSVLILSALILVIRHDSLPLLPAQEVAVTKGIEIGPVTNGFIILQEISLKKDYLNGIELLLSRKGQGDGGNNLILILDRDHTVLSTIRFATREIEKLKFYSFTLKKRIRPAIGNTCYLALYATDADNENHLLVAKDSCSRLGKTVVYPLRNDDVLSSMKDISSAMAFTGSLCLKTYESNSFFVSSLTLLMILMVLFLGWIILFYEKIASWLVKFRIGPHYLFLFFSLVFGHLFVFFTPPMQVPDEPTHFYRAYQVAKGNIFKFNQSVPVTLTSLDSAFHRMNFNLYEKTNIREIKAQFSLKTDSPKMIKVNTPDYIIPFLPQAIGIFTGNLFSASPLFLFYLGRLINLWISILLVFIAIKITPVFKELFFLLGTMPMSVYLFASVSYDVLTISISFLVIAKILQLAFEKRIQPGKKDIVILLLLAFLLAMCKPPYLVLGLLYFIIPVNRIGSLKQYLLVAALLLALLIGGSQIWLLRNFFKPAEVAQTALFNKTVDLHENQGTLTGSEPAPSPLPESAPAAKTETVTDAVSATATTITAPASFIDPNVPAEQPNQKLQLTYILDSPARYIKLMFDSMVIKAGKTNLESFIARLGWFFVSLPQWLIISFYILLFLVTATGSSDAIRISWKVKLTLLIIFLAGVILVATAMYLAWTPVGGNFIEGIQGRYFIPLAPLFFMLFYNAVLRLKFEGMINPLHSNNHKRAGKKMRKEMPETLKATPMFDQYLAIILVGFTMLSLVTTLYVLVTRYYVILD